MSNVLEEVETEEGRKTGNNWLAWRKDIHSEKSLILHCGNEWT